MGGIILGTALISITYSLGSIVHAQVSCPPLDNMFSVYRNEYKPDYDRYWKATIPNYLKVHSKDKLYKYAAEGSVSTQWDNAHQKVCAGGRKQIELASKVKFYADKSSHLCDKKGEARDLKSISRAMIKSIRDVENVLSNHGCNI